MTFEQQNHILNRYYIADMTRDAVMSCSANSLGVLSRHQIAFKSLAALQLRPFPFSVKWSQRQRFSASDQSMQRIYSLHFTHNRWKDQPEPASVCNVSLLYEMSSKDKFLFWKAFPVSDVGKWEQMIIHFVSFWCKKSLTEFLSVSLSVFFTDGKHSSLWASLSEQKEKIKFSDAAFLNGLSSINGLLASTASRHP